MEILVENSSPVLGYGCAAVIGDKIYAHGGLSVRSSDPSGQKASNAFHVFDCAKSVWNSVDSTPNLSSPSLAFHDCFTVDDRFLHFVGGWNGKTRSSCLYIYDVRQSTWLPTCKTIGFPNGGGLSGHTVTKIDNNGCLITGRLGGLLTQRRNGCVLTLRPVSFPNVFRYEIISESIESRSGHSCTPIDQNNCLLFGGRDDRNAELLKIDRPITFSDPVFPGSLILSKEDGRRFHRTTLDRPPPRRYHVTIPMTDERGAGRAVLVYGGENFASTAKGPAKDRPCCVVMSVDQKKTSAQENVNSTMVYIFEEIEKSAVRLAGHQYVGIGERIFIIGGFGENWRRNKNIYTLKF